MVGAGWISQVAFMPGVGQTGDSATTAIVSGNAEGARRLADFHGVRHVHGCEDHDRMLAEDGADAVWVALSNSMHADCAARAGKHLLVEKPLAITEAECEAMIAAAEEAGVWLLTACRLHNEPGTVEVLEWIRQEVIGEPRVFLSAFPLQATPDNHRLRAAHRRGPLQGIGIDCLNAARHALGAEPVEAVAMKGHGADPRFAEVERTIGATLRFPDDALAHLTASFGAVGLGTYRLVGTEGEITLEPTFDFQTATRMRLSRGGEVVAEREFPRTDQFAGRTAYFSDCILTGTRPEADGEEGLADLRALLAIERAALSGRSQGIEAPPRPLHPTPEMVRELPPTERRLLL